MQAALEKIIRELIINKNEVLTVKTNLIETLGFDSALMFELIFQIEVTFGVTFSESDYVISNFTRMDKILELLGKYKNVDK